MASIHKRNGIWWLSWYQNGKRHRKSLKTKDKEVAKYHKNKKEIELAENSSPIPRKKISCQECLLEYADQAKHQKAAKTLRDDLKRIQDYLNWSGIKDLKNITQHSVEKYIKFRLDQKNISLNTANHIITNIKTWLTWTQRHKYISSNPAKHVKKYKLSKNPPRYLSEKEIDKLLDAAKGSNFYPAIATALYTGLRVRELLNLEWTDFDWKNEVLNVINKDDFTTKSKRFRSIPLNKTLVTILKPYKKKSGYCFFPGGSRKWSPDKGLLAIIKRAGLKNIRWHTFRHTFASRLVQEGVSIYKVSRWLGHASVNTTMIYAHLAPTKDNDINRI
jgi:site-specific recombinase XerD